MIKFTGVLLVTLVILGGFAAKSEAQLAPQCQDGETPEETGCTPWYVAPTEEQLTQLSIAIVMTPGMSEEARCQLEADVAKIAFALVAFASAYFPELAVLTFVFGFDSLMIEVLKIIMCRPFAGG